MAQKPYGPDRPPRSFVRGHATTPFRRPFAFGATDYLGDSGVRCLAKCSRAAFAASFVIAHEVFFASAVRAKFARRNARKRFGSHPISVARAFGVMTFVIRYTSLRFDRLLDGHIIHVRTNARQANANDPNTTITTRTNVRRCADANERATTPPHGGAMGFSDGSV